MIEMIVGRLHACQSNREVVRAIRRAFERKARRDPKLRADRHKCYKQGIEIHKRNLKLYLDVMRGAF